MAQELLEIKDLTVGFLTEKGFVRATDRISLSLPKGQTLCVVGESGSGKSVASLAVMRLIDYAGGVIAEGEVHFQGQDLTVKSQEEMRRIRGNKITMVFQDPMSALNPVFTVGEQIAESLRLHKQLSAGAAWSRVIDMLRLVGIPDPEVRARQYPHEMSGGMCQRVVIAMALACDPELVIADEPTTALDVTVQAQILELMQKLKREMGMSILLITHDMGVAAEMADRIAVMYAGVIVEEGTAEDIFERSRHPYTHGLLKSIPGLSGERGTELYAIQGNIPRLGELPAGCRFSPRCPFAAERCFREEPPLLPTPDGHRSACWLESGPEVKTS
ncbi:ABC transporter ATP-binding protein [Cohnella lubricantis]|uniref:ABC transporter ATP-binding protein n=1 Tax=Cohnella lubricantis TaxID=2163172 RepID=A0A841T5Y5_9BACL|nr:ABC transporter ATP-binding protein [Cohnella lubricantis]MBB6676724.1 ABC transporter ATP-binding protein [Cohnella lubricantis]MBP2117770.1 peptide/nickel transport system ATP-binding protein [Cohnella lubricantis]